MTQPVRKTVKLGRAGGSRTIVLPKAWAEAIAVADRVDLVRTEDSIIIEPPRDAPPSIEDEPEFPQFLDFLARSAVAHPEQLVTLTTHNVGDDDLFAAVEPDVDLDGRG